MLAACDFLLLVPPMMPPRFACLPPVLCAFLVSSPAVAPDRRASRRRALPCGPARPACRCRCRCCSGRLSSNGRSGYGRRCGGQGRTGASGQGDARGQTERCRHCCGVARRGYSKGGRQGRRSRWTRLQEGVRDSGFSEKGELRGESLVGPVRCCASHHAARSRAPRFVSPLTSLTAALSVGCSHRDVRRPAPAAVWKRPRHPRPPYSWRSRRRTRSVLPSMTPWRASTSPRLSWQMSSALASRSACCAW